MSSKARRDASPGISSGEAFVRWLSGVVLALACWSVLPVSFAAALGVPVAKGVLLAPAALVAVGVSEVAISFRAKRRVR